MNTKTKAWRSVVSLYRISSVEQWSRVSAADILAVPGIGKTFLNKLRVYLAHHSVSLRGDNPPAYWLQFAEHAEDTAKGCPFTIVIDTNETLPFTFESICDGDQVISVPTVRKPLYQIGLADYTIEGMEDMIQIERKADDFFASMTGNRDSFELEISRLNDICEFAAVICELPRSEIILDNHSYGARAKSIIATVSTWRVRYPGVHWIFADGRHDAEQECYRLLRAFWWQHYQQQTQQSSSSIVDDVFTI